MTTPTAQQTRAAVAILVAVADTIRELGSVPSGTLYANLMGKMDLAGFEKLTAILKGSGLVVEKSFLLTWVGPAGPAKEGRA